MAIETGMGKKFIEELPLGIHTLSEGSPDIIRVALFGPNATLSTGTDAYSTAGEVNDGGYVAGGVVVPLTIVGKTGSVRNAAAQFSDPYINPTNNTTFLLNGASPIRGLMLYNESQANRNIFTLDFGESLSPSVSLVLNWGLGNIVFFDDVLIPLLGRSN